MENCLTPEIQELFTGNPTRDQVDHFVRQNTFPIVEGNHVTFVYVGEAHHVELRHWVYGLPSNIPLNRAGESELWSLTLELPEGSRIEYKFGVTRNGHETWEHDSLNVLIAHDPFGGNSVVQCRGYAVPNWTRQDKQSPAGSIERMEIVSESFGDSRGVGVYLPANFRVNRRYRLLVVHDGDDYLEYSRLRFVLDNLIARLEIPSLIVALTNPIERLVEYPNDPRHARHIVEELIPELERRYPLIRAAAGRCLMGASFGAVASLSTAWRYPGTFDRLLLQSGSFAFTDIGRHNRNSAFDPVVEFVNEFRQAPGQTARQIFVSCGVYESLIYENRSLVPFLQHQGMQVKYVESRDGHNWENWRDRLRDGLSWLFPGPLWVTYE
jgi:enterochelin esterase-like enzyme